MAGGNIRIMRFLDGKGRSQVVPELTERELAAIGLVTVQWGQLEHLILTTTNEIAEALNDEQALKDAAHFSMDRRLDLLKRLIKSPQFTDAAAIEKLTDVLHRIHRVNVDRQKVSHGVWDWEYQNPYRMIATSKKPKHEFTEPFDFEKLIKIAERIGEINFELHYPGGFTDDDHATNYLSREAAAIFSGRGELSPKIDSNRSKRRSSRPKGSKLE
jgi:hypothetical protein